MLALFLIIYTLNAKSQLRRAKKTLEDLKPLEALDDISTLELEIISSKLYKSHEEPNAPMGLKNKNMSLNTF